ncbi:MAG: GDCCVxC domain-containing (seleno)protein [Proteobacteria bacterium]|nr:GDCCVxC domain-containing (seleno)protein [Pseudomonadota bacterium]
MRAIPQARLSEKAVTEIRSTITCPGCGHAATEIMPTDACQYFYDCKACGELLKSKPGDCCVYCSYGTVPCPLVQESTKEGGEGVCCGG